MNVKILCDGKEIFDSLFNMFNYLSYGETYHHFCGHPDLRWNQEGYPDRARDVLVPIKQEKELRTKGIYYPAEWILEKFGRERAKTEFRDFKLLPSGVLIPSRFYVYRNRVLHINDNGSKFTGTLVEDPTYAEVHRKYVSDLFDLL